MTKRKPRMGERTRGAVSYGDPMADETFDIASEIAGAVVLEDRRSGETFRLTPDKALQLAAELSRAARNVR